MTAPNQEQARTMTGEIHDAPSEAGQSFVDYLLSPKVRVLIESALPNPSAFDRTIREFAGYLIEHPDAQKCTRTSLARAFAKGLTWGLELGRTWHLVGFNTRIKQKDKKDRWEMRAAALQDYKGRVELMLRHRVARAVDAKCVYSNEIYRCVLGTNPSVHHESIMDPKARGDLVGAYAYAKLTAFDFVVVEMDKASIDDIRREYSKQWNTEWVDAGNGQRVERSIPLEEIPFYCRKTLIHQLAKQVPMSPLARLALTDDSEAPREIDAEHDDDLRALTPAEEKHLLGAGPVPHIRTAPAPIETVALGRKPSVVLSQLSVAQDDPYGFTHTPRTSSKL